MTKFREHINKTNHNENTSLDEDQISSYNDGGFLHFSAVISVINGQVTYQWKYGGGITKQKATKDFKEKIKQFKQFLKKEGELK